MVPGDLCGPYCPRTVLFGGKEGVQMVETALAFWTKLSCSVIFVNVRRSKEDAVRKLTLPTLSTQPTEQCSSCMSRSCSVGRFGINGCKKSF